MLIITLYSLWFIILTIHSTNLLDIYLFIVGHPKYAHYEEEHCSTKNKNEEEKRG